MYEMEGPCPASPRWLASCPALPTPRAARRGQVPAQGTGLPAPPTFPGSPPRWCPFPNGENISTASAGAAQEPAASHFRFLPCPQSDPQKAGSYPHLAVVIHGLFTAYPQAPERKPENTGTAGAECNRLSFSQRLPGTHLVTGSDVGTDGSR